MDQVAVRPKHLVGPLYWVRPNFQPIVRAVRAVQVAPSYWVHLADSTLLVVLVVVVANRSFHWLVWGSLFYFYHYAKRTLLLQ
jgi:hypothetical protein